MVDPEQYIAQGTALIDRFMEEKNFQAAFQACQELLKVNPYHRKLQKYLGKIQDRIVEENEKKVDADIAATMHLWKEKRYDDLQKIYIKLYQFAPNHGHLKNLIQRLSESLDDRAKQLKEERIRNFLEPARAALQKGEAGSALSNCLEVLKIDPLHKEALRLARNAREAIIEQKLRENERVLEGADFERKIELGNSLLSIDPVNEKVRRIIQQANAHLAQQRVLAEKIHLNESIARMKELFKTAEYEKVIQACEEIDRQDPGNFTAKAFKKKAQKTMAAETEVLVVRTLTEAWKTLEPEYAKNPGAFVKI